MPTPTPDALRQARLDNPKMRERDLAHKLGVTEAQLVAAYIDFGTFRIDNDPDKVIPAVQALGEVMALTRNESAVSEKVGTYNQYHSGKHAAMTLDPEIDLRIFPNRWVHAFAVEKETEQGLRRSVQIFDAAGDAVHKIHLRDTSDLTAWDALKSELALLEAPAEFTVEPRKAPPAPKGDPARAQELRDFWDGMTDTHQFMRQLPKMDMNRLGAYRIVGAPYARRLETGAVDALLQGVQEGGFDFMLFVGNMGCIQIHTGPIGTLKAMGPWQNILDDRFNLHLRLDHIAEVYAVTKANAKGPIKSIEAFDAEGQTILQAFPVSKDSNDTRDAFHALLDAQPTLELEAAE